MKQLVTVFGVQLLAFITVIAAIVAVLSVVGLVLAFSLDILVVFFVAVTVLIISILVMRSKKISLEEFLTCVWPFSLPW